MPLKTYLLFGVLFYFCNVTFSWLGVWLADRLNLGELVFEWDKDLKKMVLCSFIALPVPLIILFFARAPGVIMVYIFIFFICLKLAYLSISVAELGIIICSTLIGMGVFRIIVVSKLLIFLYVISLLAAAVFLLNLSVKKKGDEKKSKQFEKKSEMAIRERLQRHPAFKTFCFECKFYDPQQKNCVLETDCLNREISITINNQPNKYCLYWEAAQNMRQQRF